MSHPFRNFSHSAQLYGIRTKPPRPNSEEASRFLGKVSEGGCSLCYLCRESCSQRACSQLRTSTRGRCCFPFSFSRRSSLGTPLTVSHILRPCDNCSRDAGSAWFLQRFISSSAIVLLGSCAAPSALRIHEANPRCSWKIIMTCTLCTFNVMYECFAAIIRSSGNALLSAADRDSPAGTRAMTSIPAGPAWLFHEDWS